MERELAYLIERLREALARVEGELGVSIELRGRSVVLSGTLACEERRRRVEALARRLCAPCRVLSEIRVDLPGAAGAPESLR